MSIKKRAAAAQTNYADVVGLQVDFENGTCTRLAGARGRTPGADFDCFAPFGGRRRCCAADDGTVNAFYGDAGYTEDGSNGQVMVYQPKFFYRVEPVSVVRQAIGDGYSLRKANYFVSATRKPGFRTHPVFSRPNGTERDHVLFSAYEASFYDASINKIYSDGADSDPSIDPLQDRLCSLAGKKPISGLHKAFTRANAEAVAASRGEGWHIDTIRSYAANQLLMIVEYGMMNLQTAIGPGIVSVSDATGVNCASLTGSTSPLGNGSGCATATVNEKNGIETTYSAAGKTAISYRGQENPWGNIEKMLTDITIWGDGTLQGGKPFLCTDLHFQDNQNAGNYTDAGFLLAERNGSISAMGYSETHDWLFLPSENKGNVNLPVGDYSYLTINLDGYRSVAAGAYWDRNQYAGPFCGRYLNSPDSYSRITGCRLLYLP